MHSFVATSVGSLVALAIVLSARPDLTRVAVITALLGTALAVPVYVAMEAIFPGSIAATWDLPHLSGVLLLGIPIEDLLWYLYTCALWGTYYKFATGLRPQPRSTPRGVESAVPARNAGVLIAGFGLARRSRTHP